MVVSPPGGENLADVGGGRGAGGVEQDLVVQGVGGDLGESASVTTTTWSAPMPRTISGSFPTAPTPKCAAGFGSITNPDMAAPFGKIVDS